MWLIQSRMLEIKLGHALSCQDTFEPAEKVYDEGAIHSNF